jgi:hypothetical protein
MIALLIIHGVLLLICWSISRRQTTGAAAFLFFIWGFVLTFGLVAPPVVWPFLFAFATVVALFASAARKSRKSAFVSLLTTVLVFLAFGTTWLRRYREFAVLRDEYPAVSISDRLAYEMPVDQPSQPSVPDAAVATRVDSHDPPLSRPIVRELARLEERLGDLSTSDWRSRRREFALENLQSMHHRLVYQFSIALGFGVSRMGSREAHREDLELPELPSIDVQHDSGPAPDQTPSAANDGAEVAAAREANDAIFERDALRGVHENGVFDFANRDGFGYVADRDRVYGFQPHGFRNRLVVPAPGGRPSRWTIASLELVSLLKHDAPSAYVSKNLPRMDELTEATTRPLDEFENGALEQLRSGEELVIDDHADDLRMLGSIRAAKQCTECHSVNRGALLGAFTYRLRSVSPPRRRAPPVKPVT